MARVQFITNCRYVQVSVQWLGVSLVPRVDIRVQLRAYIWWYVIGSLSNCRYVVARVQFRALGLGQGLVLQIVDMQWLWLVVRVQLRAYGLVQGLVLQSVDMQWVVLVARVSLGLRVQCYEVQICSGQCLWLGFTLGLRV